MTTLYHSGKNQGVHYWREVIGEPKQSAATFERPNLLQRICGNPTLVAFCAGSQQKPKNHKTIACRLPNHAPLATQRSRRRRLRQLALGRAAGPRPHRAPWHAQGQQLRQESPEHGTARGRAAHGAKSGKGRAPGSF